MLYESQFVKFIKQKHVHDLEINGTFFVYNTNINYRLIIMIIIIIIFIIIK